MDADGSHVKRLTRSERGPDGFDANHSPVWSPDGKRIAFVRLSIRGDTSVEELWVIGGDGRAWRLARTASAESDPTWFTDSTRIAFARNGDIYVVNANSAGERLLFRGGTMPVWSPDGTRIAFLGAGGGLEVGRADGTVRERLAAAFRRGSAPSWSPDGGWLAFQGPGGIVVARGDGSVRVRLTRPPDLRNDLAPAWRPV